MEIAPEPNQSWRKTWVDVVWMLTADHGQEIGKVIRRRPYVTEIETTRLEKLRDELIILIEAEQFKSPLIDSAIANLTSSERAFRLALTEMRDQRLSYATKLKENGAGQDAIEFERDICAIDRMLRDLDRFDRNRDLTHPSTLPKVQNATDIRLRIVDIYQSVMPSPNSTRDGEAFRFAALVTGLALDEWVIPAAVKMSMRDRSKPRDVTPNQQTAIGKKK